MTTNADVNLPCRSMKDYWVKKTISLVIFGIHFIHSARSHTNHAAIFRDVAEHK